MADALGGESLLSARAERAEAALRYVIDQAVDSWHETPPDTPDPQLFEWLGMTAEVYAAYVENRWDDLIAALATLDKDFRRV